MATPTAQLRGTTETARCGCIDACKQKNTTVADKPERAYTDTQKEHKHATWQTRQPHLLHAPFATMAMAHAASDNKNRHQGHN